MGIFAVTILFAGFWLWFVRGSVYTVTAKVLVKIGEEQALPATVMGPPPTILGQQVQATNTEMQILSSTDLLGRVVDYYHMDRPPVVPVPKKLLPRLRYEIRKDVESVKKRLHVIEAELGLRQQLSPRDAAIEELERGLKLQADQNSTVFSASLTLPYKKGISNVLNTLIDFYQSYRLRLYHKEGAKFFSKQVSANRADLTEAEKSLQAYEGRWGISQITRQEAVLLDQASAAATSLQNALIVREQASLKVKLLDQQLKLPNPDFGVLGKFDANSFPATILRQLAGLQQKRAKLLLTELASGGLVKNNRRQFWALADMLAANLRSQLAEARQVYAQRLATLDSLNRKLAALHERQMEWSNLKRRIKDADAEYAFFRQKLVQAKAADAILSERLGDVSVVQHAMDPLGPSGMSRTTLLGIAAVLALFLAFVWVAVAEFFDHRIYTPEALESYLGVPVLATVPLDTRGWGMRKRSMRGQQRKINIG